MNTDGIITLTHDYSGVYCNVMVVPCHAYHENTVREFHCNGKCHGVLSNLVEIKKKGSWCSYVAFVLCVVCTQFLAHLLPVVNF